MTDADNQGLPTIRDLDALAALVERSNADDLYIRWSHGPRADLATHTGPVDGPPAKPHPDGNSHGTGCAHFSRDELTGLPLPGLSANPLRVEPWWGDRPVRLWVARRLYDYRHLRDLRGPGVRPWVLRGEQRGRGPDNEPLVICRRVLGWVSETALEQADQAVHGQGCRTWGPLNRAHHHLRVDLG